MRKHIVLGAVLALTAGTQAMAAEGLSYSYVQAAYERGDWNLVDVNVNGFSLAGSAAFGENFYGFANYTDVSKSGFHLKPLSAGLGGHYGLGMSVDLVGGVSFESIKATGASSESGWGINAGLRGVVGKGELQGGLKYVDIGDFGNDTVYSIGGRYNFTEAFSAGLDISKWDDLDLTGFSFSLRYSF